MPALFFYAPRELMDGILTWLLEQAKSAGPLVAVAAIAVVVILWRRLWIEQQANRAMGREMTRALIANAKATARMAAKLERRRGQ